MNALQRGDCGFMRCNRKKEVVYAIDSDERNGGFTISVIRIEEKVANANQEQEERGG
jgi:hypothetical protein